MNNDTLTLKLKFKFPMWIVTPIGLVLGNTLVGCIIELSHIGWLINNEYSVKWSDVNLLLLTIILIILGVGYIVLALVAIHQMDKKAKKKEEKKKVKLEKDMKENVETTESSTNVSENPFMTITIKLDDSKSYMSDVPVKRSYHISAHKDEFHMEYAKNCFTQVGFRTNCVCCYDCSLYPSMLEVVPFIQKDDETKIKKFCDEVNEWFNGDMENDLYITNYLDAIDARQIITISKVNEVKYEGTN